MAACVLTLTSTTSCGNKKTPELQQQVSQLRSEIERMQREYEESRAKLEALKKEMYSQTVPAKSTSTTAVSQTAPRSQPADSQSTRPAQSSALTSTTTVAPAPPAQKSPAVEHRVIPDTAVSQETPGRITRTKTAYDNARALFEQGAYVDAISRFQEFLETYPASQYADNALYWMGESYLQLRQPKAAIEAFRRIFVRYPAGNKVPDGYLKSGIAYLQLKDEVKAAESFRKVIESFPDSDAAQMAREELARMEEP
ncbi:MAG: tol-pal system protein YbgF [Acidobacteriota bacterium]